MYPAKGGWTSISITYQQLLVTLKRGCPNLYKEPLDAVDSIVQEFYANAFKQKNGKTTIRGRTVKFDLSNINTFYGIPEVDDSVYRALEGEADYENVIPMLTQPNSDAK